MDALFLLSMAAFGKHQLVYKMNKELRDCSVHDYLLSRLSNNDDMEKSLSTFGSEMATSTMILGK